MDFETPPREPWPAAHRAILVCLTLIQIALFIGLFAFKGFWLDEILSINFTDGSPADTYRSLARDLHPPGYFLIFYVWQRLFPVSEYSMRLLSLLISLPTLPLLYALVSRVWTREAAIWSCVFLALSPFHAEFVAQARMYSGLEMLAVLSTLLLLAAEERPESGRAATGYAASIIACVYFHYFGFFVLASQMLYLLLRGRVAWRRWIALYAIVAVALLPLALLIPRQLAAGTYEWIQRSKVGGSSAWLIPKTFAYFLLGEWHNPESIFFIMLLTALIGPCLAAGLWATLRQKSGRLPRAAVLPIMLIVPILLAITLSQIKPMFIPRYMIETLPFFFALFGVSLSLVRRRALRICAAAALIVQLSTGLVFAWHDLPRNDWKHAVKAFQQTVPAELLSRFAIYCHDGNDRECVQYYMLHGKPEFTAVPVVLRPNGDYGPINPAALPPFLCVATKQFYDGAGLPPGYKLVKFEPFQGACLSYFRRDG